MKTKPGAGAGARRLRELMARPGIIQSLGVHDVFTGLLAEQAGLEMVFVGGFGTSASMLGLPDLNFLTMTEMADCVRRMCERLSVPVVADGDTGHGDLHNVERTVRLFEAAGAAGILLEDQVTPKRCGHFANKQVIAPEEMVAKFRTAIAARINPDFVIFARTDARQMNGIDDAIERINLYCEAGADVAFVEAPQSRGELEEISRRVKYPLFANMLTGGVTPILSAHELEALGYKFAVCPVESLMVCAKAMKELCETWKTKGRVDDWCAKEGITFNELKQTLGLNDYLRR